MRILLALGVTLLVPSLAWAADKVGVVVVGADAEVAGEMQASLEESLSSDKNEWQLVKGNEIADKLGPGEPHATPVVNDISAEIHKTLEDAEAQYYDLKYDAAEELLAGAEEKLAVDPFSHREQRIELYLLRCAVYFAQNKNKLAADDARSLLLLRTGIRKDLKRFPPPFWDFLESEKKKHPPIVVTLTGLPEASNVWLDGRAMKAPYQMKVAPGDHWMRIHAPGHKAIARKFTWSTSQEYRVPLAVKLAGDIEAAFAAVVSDNISYRDRLHLREKAQAENIDVLVVGLVGARPANVGVDPDRRIVVWRTRKDTPSAIAVRPTDGLERFNLGRITEWAPPKVTEALTDTGDFSEGATANIVSPEGTTTEPVAPPQGWYFDTAGMISFVGSLREITWQDVNDNPHKAALRSGGPGANVQLEVGRSVGKSGAIQFRGALDFYTLAVARTEFKHTATGAVTSPVGGGWWVAGVLSVGYEQRWFHRRLGTGVHVGTLLGFRTAEDPKDGNQSLRAFSGYTRTHGFAEVDLSFYLERVTLAVYFRAHDQAATSVKETETWLGQSTTRTDGAKVGLAAELPLGKRLQIRTELALDHLGYQRTGEADSLLVPLPTDPRVDEELLMFGILVRRPF